MKNIIQKILQKKTEVLSNGTSVSRRAFDIGRSRVIFAEGSLDSSSRLTIKTLVVTDRPSDLDLSQVIEKSLKESGCSREALVTSLKSPQVVTRFLRFPTMNEKELRSVLQYEIEQYVPYEAKDLYMDLSVLQESVKTDQAEHTEVFVAVVKKDYLDELLKNFKSLECELAGVDVDMLACMRSLEFFQEEDYKGHCAILDLGSQVSTLGVVRNSLPRFIRDLSFGLVDIQKKLKSRGVISEEDIKGFIHGSVTVDDTNKENYGECIENLINDVKVSFDFYQDQSDDGYGPDKLIVCGLGSGQPYILNTLAETLSIPVEQMKFDSKLELSPSVSQDVFSSISLDLPVVFGLLLRRHD